MAGVPVSVKRAGTTIIKVEAMEYGRFRRHGFTGDTWPP
jgi:hypothetical protein